MNSTPTDPESRPASPSERVDPDGPFDVDRRWALGRDQEGAETWIGPHAPAAAPTASPVVPIAGRYEDLGPLGAGGMGEVRRVRDVALDRVLAMKIIRAPLAQRTTALERFVEEARATAQLQHPGIVPVHDIGRLPDGRVWFTMKEVRGRTFGEVIREVHEASAGEWGAGPSGWTFRRLIAAFQLTCHAVAYAHERGVLHRDLKPANAMVGAHGEVYVLDWGLAKLHGGGEVEPEPEPVDRPPLRASRLAQGGTHVGQVVGTPAYMSPEQARGENDWIDHRSDLYSLGAILYEILSGGPPYGGDGATALAAVRQGPPPPLISAQGAPPPPAELVDLCERAMAREPADRPPRVDVFAEALQSWLDGAHREEQATRLAEAALQSIAEAERMVRRAVDLRAEAAALLRDVAPWEPEERKAPAWARSSEAEAAELSAHLRQLAVDQGLQGALRIAPDLALAHAALAQRYRDRHAEAEGRRDRRASAEAQSLLETHTAALPEAHPVRRALTAYLRGDGALTLVTDPPGATVHLYRYVEHNRRMVEVLVRPLGETPLHAVELPMGSYLCRIRHPACEEVAYPVEVTRQGHWNGVAPGERSPHPIWLPPQGWLGPRQVYVPSGWFRVGGDPHAIDCLPALRLWCDAFIIDRFPVTNREFIPFLDDLVAHGREAEALRHAPRERASSEGEDTGALIYGYQEGRFSLRPDADGDEWHPDWPVLYVNWAGARAYMAWRAARSGRPWRLPGELEWEKAARGVDGRWYPWGNHFDPSWCCTGESSQGRPLPAQVDTFPVDWSPFGVRGMAGNARDWIENAYDQPLTCVREERVGEPDPSPDHVLSVRRVVRGGAWMTLATDARSADRVQVGAHHRYAVGGLRGCHRLPEAGPSGQGVTRTSQA